MGEGSVIQAFPVLNTFEGNSFSNCYQRWDAKIDELFDQLQHGCSYVLKYLGVKMIEKFCLPSFAYLQKKVFISCIVKVLDSRCTKTVTFQIGKSLISSCVQAVYPCTACLQNEVFTSNQVLGGRKQCYAAIQFVRAWQDNEFNGVPLFQWIIPVRGNANEKGQKMACVHFLI